MRLGFLVLGLVSLGGCTRASLLVCHEVTAEGVCRQPTTELVVGRQYTLFATGFGLPRGTVEIRLHETVAGRERSLASVTATLSEDRDFLAHPLTLPHVGDYRVELLDHDGDSFRSLRVRAPRPTFHTSAPAVPTARLPSAPAPSVPQAPPPPTR